MRAERAAVALHTVKRDAGGTVDALYEQLAGFIAGERLISDPLRLLTWGTDASFSRLVPERCPNEIARGGVRAPDVRAGDRFGCDGCAAAARDTHQLPSNRCRSQRPVQQRRPWRLDHHEQQR